MITPLDIENKKFSRKMVNGYDVEEVDDFLDQITNDYEQKCKELSEKARKIAQLEKDVAHYRTIEKTSTEKLRLYLWIKNSNENQSNIKDFYSL